MASLAYVMSSLWQRLRLSSGLAWPLGVTALFSLAWAWVAAASLPPLPTATGAALAGAVVAGTWLRFSSVHSGRAGKAGESLAAQLMNEASSGRRLGIFDRTSGLYNRTYLELRLQEEYLRCDRYGSAMSLITIRLSDIGLPAFSSDSWGPVALEVARTMANSVRCVDITLALAPLEFAICLVRCDRVGAGRAISRLIREFDGKPLDIGLAVYPDDNCDGKALIELARRRSRRLESLGFVA